MLESEPTNAPDPVEKKYTEKELAIIHDWKVCMRRNFTQAGFVAIFGGLFLKFYLGSRKNPPIPPVFGPRDVIFAIGNFCVATLLGTPLCFLIVRNKHKRGVETVLDENKRQEYLEGNSPMLGQNLGKTPNTGSTDSNWEYNVDLDAGPSESNFSHLHLDLESFSDNLVETDSEEKPKVKIPETTYAELRKRNRENFAKFYVEKTMESTLLPSKHEFKRPKNPFVDM